MQSLSRLEDGDRTFTCQPPPKNFNFAAYLFGLNAARSEKNAYIDDNDLLTFGQLEKRARRFATVLRSMGVYPEQRILLVMLDTIELPIVFLGALFAGIVPVFAHPLANASDLAGMLTDSRARAVIVSGAVQSNVVQALKDIEYGECRLIVSGQKESSTANNLASLIETATEAQYPTKTDGDEIAFWLYSSGSTGKPKGTVHTHANLYWTAELYAKQILAVCEEDVMFSAAKLFIAYGLGNGLTFPLSVGATCILTVDRVTPEIALAILLKYRVTVFFCVPGLCSAILSTPSLPPSTEFALRVCTSAGETLPRGTGQRFATHFGCDILDGVGLTEMLHIFLSNRAGAVEYGSVGRAVCGYEVELRDELGAVVVDGEIGDLYVRGPSAAMMYWKDREQNRMTFVGDWIRTGDKYRLLPSDNYAYVGRADDMLKIEGQYVSPIEIEMILMQHESIVDAAVVAVDKAGGVRPCAYVVLRQGTKASGILRSQLMAFANSKLASFSQLADVVFIDGLPKTSSGKNQRFKLRERQ